MELATGGAAVSPDRHKHKANPWSTVQLNEFATLKPGKTTTLSLSYIGQDLPKLLKKPLRIRSQGVPRSFHTQGVPNRHKANWGKRPPLWLGQATSNVVGKARKKGKKRLAITLLPAKGNKTGELSKGIRLRFHNTSSKPLVVLRRQTCSCTSVFLLENEKGVVLNSAATERHRHGARIGDGLAVLHHLKRVDFVVLQPSEKVESKPFHFVIRQSALAKQAKKVRVRYTAPAIPSQLQGEWEGPAPFTGKVYSGWFSLPK